MAQDIIDQLSSLVSEFITRTTAKVRKDFREIRKPPIQRKVA